MHRHRGWDAPGERSKGREPASRGSIHGSLCIGDSRVERRATSDERRPTRDERRVMSDA
jgi:hypothetical protein